MTPDYSVERSLKYDRIAGIDEVGRGPWAGPVTAAAVILDPQAIPIGLNDSKKLTEAKRVTLAEVIHATASVGIGSASVEEIDSLNILQASYLAMRRAVDALPEPPDYVLVDGNRMPPEMPCDGQTIIGGDAKSASIAAASIVAKVHRDNYMSQLATEFPAYGWETNRGYGTQMHQVSLLSHGPTQHHRRSFKPIYNMLYPPKS